MCMRQKNGDDVRGWRSDLSSSQTTQYSPAPDSQGQGSVAQDDTTSIDVSVILGEVQTCSTDRLSLSGKCNQTDYNPSHTTHRFDAGYRPAGKAARTPHCHAHRTSMRPRLPISWRFGGAVFPTV